MRIYNLRFTFYALLLSLGIGTCSLDLSAQVRLEWDASTYRDVAAYRILFGQTRGIYPSVVQVPGTTTKTTISNLTAGVWYFVATALSSNGLESVFSNEISWVNRPAAPVLRLTGPRTELHLQSAPSAAGPWTTIAVITGTDPPVLIEAQPGPRMFRTILINLPPLPGEGR